MATEEERTNRDYGEVVMSCMRVQAQRLKLDYITVGVDQFFCKTDKFVIIINLYLIGCNPSYQQLSQVPHSRAPVEIMLLQNTVKAREREEEYK